MAKRVSAIRGAVRSIATLPLQIDKGLKSGITQWVVIHKNSVGVASVHEALQWRNRYMHIMIGTVAAKLGVPALDEGEQNGDLEVKSTDEAGTTSTLLLSKTK